MEPGNTPNTLFRFVALLLYFFTGFLIHSYLDVGWLWRFLATLAAGGSLRPGLCAW